LDKRKKHGGSRNGAGRKKGSGVSCIIKKHVDNFMIQLLQDDCVKELIKKDLKQLSITSGWIYLIKDIDNGSVKIGVTQKDNPNHRLSQYVSHKMNVELLFIDEIEDCFEVENELHISLEMKRLKGDWFNLDDSDVLNIITIINKHKFKKIYYGRW